MKIGESHPRQRMKHFCHLCSGKPFFCFTYSKIHDLGNVISVYLIFQHLFGISETTACFTYCFDGIHKSHIRDDHSFSFAYRTFPFSIKREKSGTDATFSGKNLPDFICRSKVCCRSGPQTDSNVFLTDINRFFRACLCKMFHQ